MKRPGVSTETPAFTPVPSLLLVGADEVLSQWCALAAPALRIVSVAHAGAALEKIALTRPMVVLLVAKSVGAAEQARVQEIAAATGSEVLTVRDEAPADLEAKLGEAIARAEKRIA